MNTSFDWIFFDCFNTLIDDFDETGDETGVGPMLHLPVEAGFFATKSEFRDNYDRWRKSQWTGDDWGEVNLADRLRDILKKKNEAREDEADALVSRMIKQFELEYPATLRLTPGVREMLQGWRDKVKMGVVSNFYLRHWPQRMLMKFGLNGFFDFVIDSTSFGFKKPGRPIYIGALQRAGIPIKQAERVLFIGDNLTNDVLAPMELGLKAIYLDRSTERPSSTRVPEDILSINHWDEFKPENLQAV